ncbi:uncharacterized protein E5676_scaffold325G00090 [Cucumis melo var. makuwa]|uniref:Uncharacterized protein n=1 Tax=Cucumis melo var. makuwa TaxID=1194695 RepID=A0A5A7T0D7_CUCMM|nr:uncharacterized protein E6C27_scaffold1480G00270 [Cucumis melo var. makuwa]TYK27339.1 uncharacterized protein E5676_scaffold325G00090 [Cucumis melo var. makuwa]
MRERENLSHDFFIFAMRPSLDAQSYSGCIINEDVENEQLNVLKIVVGHCVDEHIEDDTLYRPDVDPTMVKIPIALHVIDDFINDDDEQLSIQRESNDLFNNTRGMSLVGDTSEYIEIVKGSLQQWFKLDFTDQALV